MQIDWTTLSFYVIAIFTFTGFLRGWWKEMVTTSVLALFVFFLKNPDWATSAIEALNRIITFVTLLIPMSVDTVAKGDTQMVVAVTSSSQATPYLIDPSSPSSWLNLFLVSLGGSVLLSRYLSLPNPPTGMGQFFGALIGLLNGAVATGVVREYLDGRALPGSSGIDQQSSSIALAGTNGLHSASSELVITATGLPNITVLDSMIPWLVMVTGGLFLFAVIKSRFKLEKSADGHKINYKKLPPFYGTPPKKEPPKTPEEVIKKLYS